MADDLPDTGTALHRVENAVLRFLLGAVGRLPWRARGAVMGWLVRAVIGPVAGWSRRADANLARIWPDKPLAERRHIRRAALDNIGRSFGEMYDPKGLRARMAETPFEGAGAEPMLDALMDERPVVLVSGHYGNYEAPKAALAERGFPVAMIYRPAANPHFNAHYWATLSKLSGPIFAQGKGGTAAFFENAKAGHLSALLFDVHTDKGIDLPFLGHNARTALSAARLALETGAVLIPFWGIRKPDGVSFRLLFDAPIPHSDEQQMMAELTRRLEDRIAEDPGQWLWSHRRWKV